MSDEFLKTSREEFGAHYAESLFVIHGPFYKESTNGINEANALQVYLRNFDVIKSTLDIFGAKIQRIYVTFKGIGEAQAIKIMEHIKNKCSTSLQMLSLENCPKNFQLNTEFKLVSRFTFSSFFGPSTKLKSSLINFKWSTVFPNTERLELKQTSTLNWKHFEGEWQKMDRFIVELSKLSEQNEQDTKHVVNFFKSNPKIKYLTIQNCNLNLIKESNQLLELEYLKIMGLSENYLNSNIGIILKKLWCLAIHSEVEDEIPVGIVFMLDKFQIIIQHKFTEKWLDFVSKLENLEAFSLSIVSVQELSKEQFLSIPANVPTAKRVSISCGSQFTAADIGNFIEKSEQGNLIELKLKILMAQKEHNMLEEKLPFDWIMNEIAQTETGRVILSLER